MKSKKIVSLVLFLLGLLVLKGCSSSQMAKLETSADFEDLEVDFTDDQVFYHAKGLDKISLDDIEKQIKNREGKLYDSLLDLLEIEKSNGLYFIGDVKERHKDEKAGNIKLTLPIYRYSQVKREGLKDFIEPFDGDGLRQRILVEGFKNAKEINLEYKIEDQKVNLELKLPKNLDMARENQVLDSLRKDLIEDIHKIALSNAKKRLEDEEIVFSQPLDLRKAGLINYFLVTEDDKAYIVSQRDIKLLNENENLVKYDFYNMGNDKYLIILWDRDKIDPNTKHCNLYMLNDKGLREYKKANLLDAKQVNGEKFEIQVIRNGEVQTLIENIDDIFAYQY